MAQRQAYNSLYANTHITETMYLKIYFLLCTDVSLDTW